jgi:hypothetical protein
MEEKRCNRKIQVCLEHSRDRLIDKICAVKDLKSVQVPGESVQVPGAFGT